MCPASASESAAAGQGPPDVHPRAPESGAVLPVCEMAVRDLSQFSTRTCDFGLPCSVAIDQERDGVMGPRSAVGHAGTT